MILLAPVFSELAKAGQEAGLPVISAELTLVPQTTVKVTGKDAGVLLKLINSLDDLDDVASVELARNWLGSGRLRIRTRTLSALKDVPGAEGNECVLPVRRRDRTNGRELAVATSLALSGLELKRIEDGED